MSLNTSSLNFPFPSLSCAEAREIREKTIKQTRDLAQQEKITLQERRQQQQLSSCLERIHTQASNGFNFAYCEYNPFVAKHLQDKQYHLEQRTVTANIEYESITYKGLHDLELITSIETVNQAALFVFWGQLPAPLHRNTVDLYYSDRFDLFQSVTWKFSSEEKNPSETN